MDIKVYAAREHNLKNINVSIPRHSLTVITGMSGSGKSSLAFDTLYAEGQRRYIDTFGTYARGFLGGGMERPDVDEIRGLGPVIAIEQKTTNRNPRSTVGTVTDIYDFFRLLYARAGEARSYLSGKKMVRYTEEQIVELCLKEFSGRKIYILAPLVRQRKGHYKELFERLRKKGYLRVRIDGDIKELRHGMKVDRYKTHNIEVEIDKLMPKGKRSEQVLSEAIARAMRESSGLVSILDADTGEERRYSRTLMCPETGLAYADPAPNLFSFNSPEGACPRCRGIGHINTLDIEKIIPDNKLSIYQGGIAPLGKWRDTIIFRQIEELCRRHDLTVKTAIKDLPEDLIDEILHGTTEDVVVHREALGSSGYVTTYDGLAPVILKIAEDDELSARSQQWAEQFLADIPCPDCEGTRLNIEARHYFIADKNISELSAMDIGDLTAWMDELPPKLSETQSKIAIEILKEINSRLGFLMDVGLGYLSLDRQSASLSGGESQRIRLATQIGTQLVEVLYILDEPSIGLHQRDNMRLVKSLKDLRDIGNTVIVVEHDRETMEAADYIVDMGPAAGRHGGEVVFEGTPEEMKTVHTLTADYLENRRSIDIPAIRRQGNSKFIELKGAKGHNLKNVDLKIPLGTLTCVTGVSGSGKSTLINETLYPIISQNLYRSTLKPLSYDEIIGIEFVDKIIAVDQTPIGRTPRSNPATYTGVFTDIRSLFVALPESKARGYKPGRFSFNVKDGSCPTCKGSGYRTITMNFLPDVFAPCETCAGKRYTRDTLEIRYRGKSIADVLDMTINAAAELFEAIPKIATKLRVLQEVGLGYIKLGQSSTTLSGGESQRMKLATELARKDTGHTIYILDEPTTGLHFEDIRALLKIVNRLVDRGNTVIIIEHNLDIIKCADYIVDMGPEGGSGGGSILAVGTPEEVAEANVGFTAPYIDTELKRSAFISN